MHESQGQGQGRGFNLKPRATQVQPKVTPRCGELSFRVEVWP